MAAQPASDVDSSLLGLVMQWRVVVAELARVYGIDLYVAEVRARPWPGVRTMIFSLIDQPSRLRDALTRR